jgi:alcohol dehydrogenase class IV
MADLFKYLRESKVDPQSVEIRQKLQVAAWMSMWPMKMENYRYSNTFVDLFALYNVTLCSALGLSHALGHKLGAKYGIPHGITSCLTLAPTVLLKSELASEQDKRALATALVHLHEPSTGSVDEDVRRLASLINEFVHSVEREIANYDLM